MRWLRSSLFPPGGGEAISTVTSESDLKYPIEVVANHLRSQGYPPFVDIEIFEHPGPLEAAAMAARRRSMTRIPQRKRNEDITRDWAIAMLHITTPNGIVQTGMTAPLTSIQLRNVLLDIVQHPEYKNQTFNMYANDGKSVSVVKKMVAIIEKEQP